MFGETQYQKNISKGLCGVCKEEIQVINSRTGLLYKTCVEHRSSSKGKKNTTVIRRYAEGRCPDCGGSTILNIKTGKKYIRCTYCNDRHNRRARENRKIRQCVDCDKLLTQGSRAIRCIECADKRMNFVQKRARENQIATGICVRCRKNSIDTKQECRPCANVRSAQVSLTMKNRREDRKSRGVCIRCEMPVNEFHVVNEKLVRYKECVNCNKKFHGGRLRKNLVEVEY